MNVPIPPATLFPRHVRWFAVWTWRPWKLWMLMGVPLLLAAYALSSGPVVWHMRQRGIFDPSQPVVDVFTVEIIYRPLLVIDYQLAIQERRLLFQPYIEWWDVR